MSGPKYYSPPPRFSMSVFNGKLNDVFSLQSKVKSFCSELEALSLSDKSLNVEFDCRSRLYGLLPQIESTAKTPIFDYKGTFGQTTYNKINSEIGSIITELKSLLSNLELIKQDFMDRKRDLESYYSYLVFYDNSKTSFDDFKNQIKHFLRSNIESKAPTIYDVAEKSISQIDFELVKTEFSFGFDNSLERNKSIILKHLSKKEDEVNLIRTKTNDDFLDKIGTLKEYKSPMIQDVESDEMNSQVLKIKQLINNCGDNHHRKKYESQFESLLKSESLKNIYFYKELQDQIIDCENTRIAKTNIELILKKVESTKFVSKLLNERAEIILQCIKLQNKEKIGSHEVDDLQYLVDNLLVTNSNLMEEEQIKFREHVFLKSQLTHCLENLGYEVMDDLQVIDFEKENDFLFKINGQDNYLNLRFNENGSLNYCFQIPDRKDDLSDDRKKMKLYEMKVTCDDFKNILYDLKSMGLEIALESERPIENSSLISIPQSKAHKLKIKNHKKESEKIIRKKYLDKQ